MNLLILSLDKEIISPGQSDSEARFSDYSQYFTSIDIFVPAEREISRRINSKIRVRSFSGNQLVKIIKIVWFGIESHKQKELNLIIANDPLIGLAGVIIKIVTGTRLLVNVLGLEIMNPFWLEQSPIKNRLLKVLQLVVLRNADGIRSDSKLAITILTAIGIEKTRVYFVPAIPSRQAILRLRKIVLKGHAKRKIVQLLAIGTLTTQKGFKVLLEGLQLVVKTFPLVHLTIVGDGPQRTSLARHVKKLGLFSFVTFSGTVDYRVLPSYYHQSDLFVLSSYFEGGPRVVMEAAFCRLPIVSTDVGSVSDMLRNSYSGLIVPTGNSVALAEALIFLLQNPGKGKLFATRARKKIEKYCNYEQNTQDLISVWRRTALGHE